MGIRASGRALAFFGRLGHRQRCALPSTNDYIDVVWCQELSAGRMVRKLKAYLINLLARAARSPYFALDTTYHEHEIPDLLDTTDTPTQRSPPDIGTSNNQLAVAKSSLKSWSSH